MPPPTSSLLVRVVLYVSVCCGVPSFGLFLSFLALTPSSRTHWIQKTAATTARGQAPNHIFTISTKISARATRNVCGGPAVWVDRGRGCPQGSHKHKVPNGEKKTRGMQLQGLPVRMTAAAVAPLLMSSQPPQRCRSTVNSTQKARRVTQLWNVSSRMVQRKWQIGTDLTANKPISEIFHAFCSVGGWGVCGGREGGRVQGAKRRGREEGRPKLSVGWEAKDVWQYSPPPNTLLLFQSAARWCGSWKSCKVHKSWSFIKR